MEELKVRHFKVLTLPTGILRKNSIYYVKGTTDTTVKTYITDLNGVPTPLNDQQTKRLTELLDFPENYTGQAGKAVVVKQDETGTEFKILTGSGGPSITEWTQENADAGLYDIGTFVSHETKIWKSLIDNNTDEPILLSNNWEAQSVEDFIGAILTEDVIWSNPDLGKPLPLTSAVGTSFTEAWKQLVQRTFYPTFTNFSFSLTNSAGGLRKIGEDISFYVQGNYVTGKILGQKLGGVWYPSNIAGNRTGNATNYILNGESGGSQRVVNATVFQGTNSFTGKATYGTGDQPLDSEGVSYLTPLPAGETSTLTTSFEGVYPIFATVSTLVTPNELPLYSMLSGNNIVIDLIAENDGNKQFIEIPQIWLASRPLQSIQYFNPVSNQYDTSNKISDFAITNTTNIILGNVVNYVRYTNISPDRGTIKIKLIF